MKTKLAALCLAVLLATACSASDPDADTEVTVLAAASLTESFVSLGKAFESTHPRTKINLSFGSSSTLAAQVKQGAPADVFAAANEPTMRLIIEAGLASRPKIFVTNKLQIAVPQGNPARITGLKDFADPAKRIAICSPEVPCGAAAQQVFDAAGLTAKPDTLEQDVKATLQKVRLGEVDAGLVYATDIRAATDSVQGNDFPEAGQAINRYPIATLAAAKEPELAEQFVEFVLSAQARQVFEDAGFGHP